MTLLIDSHVNLHHHAFAEDRDAVIERARDGAVVGEEQKLHDEGVGRFGRGAPVPARAAAILSLASGERALDWREGGSPCEE